MNIIVRGLVLLVALLVSACANVRLGAHFSTLEPPQPNKALVYIYRPYVRPSSAYGVVVHMDGKEMVALPTDSYTRLYLSPGTHELAFNWPAVSMQSGIQGNSVFEAGKTYFIKYSVMATFRPSYGVSSVWTFSATLIDAAKAVDEMKCCSFSKPAD